MDYIVNLKWRVEQSSPLRGVGRRGNIACISAMARRDVLRTLDENKANMKEVEAKILAEDMRRAVDGGDLGKVGDLIDGHPGLLRTEIDSQWGPMLPLHVACLKGEEEIAIALIEAERRRTDEEGGDRQNKGGKRRERREGEVPSYNVKNKNGFSPLFCTDSARVVELLLQFDDLEATRLDGRPLLMECARFGIVTAEIANHDKVSAQFAQTHSGKLPLEVGMEKAELRGRYGRGRGGEEREQEGCANYVGSCMEILEGLRRGSFAEAKMINVRAVLSRCNNAGRLRAEEFPLGSSPLFLQWLMEGRSRLVFSSDNWAVRWDGQLVHSAARRGDEELFDFLLDDADVASSVGIDLPLGRNHPVVVAANYGYFKILEVFGRKRKDVLCRGFFDSDKTLLHEVFNREWVKRPDGSRLNDVSYVKCTRELLKNSPLREKINEKDQEDNTALHLAARLEDKESIMTLLQYHAAMFTENKRKICAFEIIPVDTLTEFLNSECIKSESKGDIQITLDFNFMKPPPAPDYSHRDQIQGSPPVNKAMNHFVHINLEDQVGQNCVSDIESSPLKNGPATATKSMREAEPKEQNIMFELLSRSDVARERKALIMHPVIASYLWLKWMRIRIWFFLNLSIYVAFASSVSVYVYTQFGGVAANETTDQGGLDIPESIALATSIIAAVFCAFQSLKEFFQIIKTKWSYFLSIENIAELLLILSTLGIMIPYWAGSDLEDTAFVRSLSAFVILLSWTLVFLVIGRHPAFSKYVSMFVRVSVTYMKIYSIYIIMIIAHGFAFYIINVESGESIGETLFKLPTMAIGEADPGEFYEGEGWILAMRILTFISFIFFITIVMMNLLNGLAVSDVAKIREDAKIDSWFMRVEMISAIESMPTNPKWFLFNRKDDDWKVTLIPSSDGVGYENRVEETMGNVVKVGSLSKDLLDKIRKLTYEQKAKEDARRRELEAREKQETLNERLDNMERLLETRMKKRGSGEGDKRQELESFLKQEEFNERLESLEGEGQKMQGKLDSMLGEIDKNIEKQEAFHVRLKSVERDGLHLRDKVDSVGRLLDRVDRNVVENKEDDERQSENQEGFSARLGGLERVLGGIHGAIVKQEEEYAKRQEAFSERLGGVERMLVNLDEKMTKKKEERRGRRERKSSL